MSLPAGLRISRKPDSYDLEFDPPKGTDAHSDALEAAYPNERSLTERRAQAAINSFKSEKQGTGQRSHSTLSESFLQSTSTSSSLSASSREPAPRAERLEPPQLTLEQLNRASKRKQSSIHGVQQAQRGITFKLSRNLYNDATSPKLKKTKTQQRKNMPIKRIPACGAHHERKRKVSSDENTFILILTLPVS